MTKFYAGFRHQLPNNIATQNFCAMITRHGQQCTVHFYRISDPPRGKELLGFVLGEVIGLWQGAPSRNAKARATLELINLESIHKNSGRPTVRPHNTLNWS